MSDWSQPGDEPVAPPYGAGYQPPAYQPPTYEQPAYEQPAYQQPYAPGDYQPVPTQQPGYEQPGYQQPYPPYPYAYGPGHGGQLAPGERRPGTLTAAAVLGYVAGGLLILAGFLLFFGASIVTRVEDDLSADHSSYTAELAVAGVANLIAAGLLIAGSVSMTGRNPNGRTMYVVGSAIVLVATVYWLARWAPKASVAPIVVYGLIFAALVIVGLGLAFTRDDNAWLAGRPGP